MKNGKIENNNRDNEFEDFNDLFDTLEDNNSEEIINTNEFFEKIDNKTATDNGLYKFFSFLNYVIVFGLYFVGIPIWVGLTTSNPMLVFVTIFGLIMLPFIYPYSILIITIIHKILQSITDYLFFGKILKNSLFDIFFGDSPKKPSSPSSSYSSSKPQKTFFAFFN